MKLVGSSRSCMPEYKPAQTVIWTFDAQSYFGDIRM
jgi:hypothetical protein